MEKLPEFSAQEFERRHGKIREAMELRGIDCLIIYGHTGIFGSSAADLRYVCGDIDILDQCYVVFPYNGDVELYGVARRLSVVDPLPVGFPDPLKAPNDKAVFRPGWDYAGTISGRIKELGLEKGTIGIVTMRDFPSYLYLDLKKELPLANFVSAGDPNERTEGPKPPLPEVLADCELADKYTFDNMPDFFSVPGHGFPGDPK